MRIIVKNALVVAHQSIRLIEPYHGSFSQIHSIITAKLPKIKPELALQISFKELQNSVSPNDLVSTLLVFGAYLDITNMDRSLPTIIQHNIAMHKAMEEVTRLHIFRQVNNILNT